MFETETVGPFLVRKLKWGGMAPWPPQWIGPLFPCHLIRAVRFHNFVRKHRVLKTKFTLKTTKKTPTKNPQKRKEKVFIYRYALFKCPGTYLIFKPLD